MSRLLPTFERVTAAPEELRVPLTLLARQWGRGESPAGVSRAVRDWMEGDAISYLAGGAFFEKTGGFLRRFSLPDRRPDGEWAVPPAIELAGRAGVTFEGQAKLAPLFPLGAQRVLWFARGYRPDHRYIAVPVVFDPQAAEPWLPLRATKTPDDSIQGTAPRSLHVMRDGTAILTGEVDGGAEMHLDEFIPVALHYELNVAAGLYRLVSDAGLEARSASVAPACLAVVPIDNFAEGRKISFDREGDLLVLRPPHKKDLPDPFDLAFPAEGLAPPPPGSPPNISWFGLHGTMTAEGAVAHDFVTRLGARRVLVWTPGTP